MSFQLFELFVAYLFQPTHVDILWRHEEDGGQHSGVHLGDRDGEDEEPGEDTGDRVDHSQDGITQKKPKISADAPLQRFKDRQTKIMNRIQVECVKVLELMTHPVIRGLFRLWLWDRNPNVHMRRHQKRPIVLDEVVITVRTVGLLRYDLTRCSSHDWTFSHVSSLDKIQIT